MHPFSIRSVQQEHASSGFHSCFQIKYILPVLNLFCFVKEEVDSCQVLIFPVFNSLKIVKGTSTSFNKIFSKTVHSVSSTADYVQTRTVPINRAGIVPVLYLSNHVQSMIPSLV